VSVIRRRLRPGFVWHPFNFKSRELGWTVAAADDAGWVWFPHRQELWFYPPGGFTVERGLVVAELVTDKAARETMLRLIREDEASARPSAASARAGRSGSRRQA
jgi:hypothetical protein